MKKGITYLDLFSGAGGFALGLKQAGFRLIEYYFSEIDIHAIANYQYNFPHARQLGDIKHIGKATITAPDIISFGSPCQDVSIAGGRTGIKGQKSGLFFEAVRLIKKYCPRVFLFENVKGLFSSNEGKDFEVVLKTLADTRLYEIEWQLVDSAWFLPQQRQRIYLVGHLRGQPFRQIFPLTEGDQLSETFGGKGQGRKDIASTITSTYSKGVHGRGETYIRTRSSKLRRLTPVECERLQGFPDDWTAYGLFDGQRREIPDTQRYKLMGNAVSVTVVKAVAKKIIQTSSSMDELNGGYKLFKGIALSDAAFKRKYGHVVRTPDTEREPDGFVRKIKDDLTLKVKHNKLTIERIAAGFGITDKNEVKELTELAIVETARSIALQSNLTIEEKYKRIVDLYESQVNLSHRTSQSILLQQYSTPAPIGYLMGIFCRIDHLHETGGYAFEPSAGNGLLTIAAQPSRVYVNEVDEVRRRNLTTQGFANVWNRDAAQPFFDVRRNFMAVLTNPPFGMLDTKMVFDGYPIRPLEHVMAIHALDCVSSDGKAAIIIGGHTGWDKKGRIAAGKNRVFLNYLYHHYHVADVIQVNGKKLYSRQGTGFNTRLILINGRKEKPEGAAPVHDTERDAVVNSFDDLFERVIDAMEGKQPYDPINHLAEFYEHVYIPAEKRYPAHILFFHDEEKYEVFEEHAYTLNRLCGLSLNEQFTYKNDLIPLIRIGQKELEAVFEKLHKFSVRYLIVNKAGELEQPQYISTLANKEVNLEKMENEAKKLLAALKAKVLGSTGDKGQEIWQVPVKEFLEREKEKHTLIGWKPTKGLRYALPQKQEYRNLFQDLPYNDPYGHLISNPYSIEGSRNLKDWSFVATCLKIIHEYEVRKAIKKGHIIADEVINSYPALQQKQQTRLVKRDRLGDPNNEQQQVYEQVYEEEYLPLWEEHNQAMIFLLRDGAYEVYGWDTLVLSHYFGIEPSAHFNYNSQQLDVTVISPDRIHSTVARLRKVGFRFIVNDDPKLSWPVNRTNDLYAGKSLWEITLAKFLATEEQEYEKQLAYSDNPFTYDLPYAPEYVAVFNTALTGDPYQNDPSNPYSITGKKQLQDPKFRQVCLETIHQYNIRLAMKLDIIVGDKVIKDYPQMKLRQDARIVYLKTLVNAGNQLNGHPIRPYLDFDAAIGLIRETGRNHSLQAIGSASDKESEIAKEQWYARYKRSLYYQKKYPPYYIIVISDGEGLYEAFGNSALMLSPNYIDVRYKGRLYDYFVFGASELDHYREIVRKERITGMIVIRDPIDVSDDSLGTADKESVSETLDFDALHQQFEERKIKFPKSVIIFETPLFYCTFDEQAEQVAATCHTPLLKILRNGEFRFIMTSIARKSLGLCLSELENSGFGYIVVPRMFTISGNAEDQQITARISAFDINLGAPYEPVSNACIVLDTQVPDSMAYETHEALAQIKDAVGGDVDNFVRDRLGYSTKTALCKALSAEQTDAVMMAIYNIEARGQGMIIGDQTGIGKGRVAAAMIRYACHQGMKPVFLTEKANLFSDIYRDLYAIGSGRLKPFIVNGRESKTDIKDEDGNIIYQALPYHDQQSIFSSRAVPANFDFVVATYTQFNSPDKKPEKPAFLSAIAEDNLFILDEAHNSSGSSNTGNFLQGVVARTRGVVFLSATFAKRPDNMPIYAMKTAISDCNMSRDQLVEAIQRGGVALQEVLSSQLVAEGQMLRRERSFEGVEVNYITLTDKSVEHQAIADNITVIIRDIIAFQKDYIDVIVEELDDIAVGEGKQVDLREGTSQAGVDNMPYFSKVFNIINQMLFSIKAASVAERAIERLQEGKKPIIAFASTMGSFLEDMEDENGLPVADGSTINPDFSEVLRRGLEGVMRYTEKDINGQPEYKKFEISELSPEAQQAYYNILQKIEHIATGITLSPIDVVIKKIREAGYSVAEVTGRKFELQMNWNGSKALVMARKRINTNDAFRQFNNNEIDVLMINQSGSTGASAHAIPTAKVSKEEVRQRVMIVLQAELDINTEVQKRGRINRTGQIIKPIYDYITSAIPAEMRLMMMLQKKLKSLDANTASNQKQSTKILDVPDFLNKYGDRVVKEYLLENPSVNRMLDDPLRLKDKTDSDQGDAEALENAAHKVSGRVAVLSVQMQTDFYSEITDRYSDYVAYLQQIGEYDLELEAMNLQAETLNSKVVKMGSGSGSLFSEDSILETVKANVLKKPFTTTELDNLLNESLQGQDAKQLQKEIIDDYKEETGMALEIEEKEIQERHNELDKRIYLEKKFQKLKTEREQEDYVKMREQQIEEARQKALKVLREKSAARSYYLEKVFRFFYVGRNLNFPIDNFNGYKEYVPTVFIGFVIDWKRKNPFLPSKIKLRFALANSNKYFAMPASYDDIDKIIGASSDLPQLQREQILHNWGQYIQENNADRKIRHIITGNLLQAFSDFRGKLVNYTTIDGKVSKGILLPENWVADEQVQDKVSIPVYKALPLIKSLVNGKSITTSTGIGFLRQPEWYKIIVPMSRKVAGDIYLDKDLLTLIDTNNFNRVSDKMVGMLDEKHIEKFVAIIQDKHNCSVTITRHQFNSMEKQASAMRHRKPIRPPEPEKVHQPGDNIIELLELEAEALKLKLRLKLRLAA